MKNSTTRLTEKHFVHHFSHFSIFNNHPPHILIPVLSNARLKTLYLRISRNKNFLPKRNSRIFFFFFFFLERIYSQRRNILCRLTSSVRCHDEKFHACEIEFDSKNLLDGWRGRKRDENDWWEGKREKEKDARLLKSPFMVLESSLESQSTFVFAIDSLSLLATPHPPPSSIFAPSTICFIIVNSTGSLSLCSTNNRLLIIRSSLVEDFVNFGISMEEISFNRYRYRPLPFPFLSRKHLENEHENNWEEDDPRRWNGTRVYSGEVGRGWTITNDTQAWPR